MNIGKFLANFPGDFVEVLGVDLPRFVPSELWVELDKYRNNPTGMKRYLAKNHKTILHTEYITKKQIDVAGEFAMDEEKMQVFTIRPATMDDKLWEKFKFEVIITMMHEHIHFMQWMYDENEFDFVLLHKEDKNVDLQEEREYYACWSEIQAYAHCILMEIKARNVNLPAHKALTAKRIGYYSPTLKNIRSKFDGFDYPIKYLYREVLRWEKRYERYAETLNM